MVITDDKKEDYWTVLSAERRPPRLTVARMKKLKALVWDDEDFWSDIVARHGGIKLSAAELRNTHPEIYLHCLGNFHGMLCQTAWYQWRIG